MAQLPFRSGAGATGALLVQAPNSPPSCDTPESVGLPASGVETGVVTFALELHPRTPVEMPTVINTSAKPTRTWALAIRRGFNCEQFMAPLLARQGAGAKL